MDLYLKANDQATLQEALLDANLLQDVNGEYLPVFGVAVDEIGTITYVDPVTENVTTIPGWHVNLRVAALTEEQESIIEPFMISPPATPFRVWF